MLFPINREFPSNPLTIISISAPIALATVIVVGWLLIAHRLYLRDKMAGRKESGWQILWLLSGPVILGSFFFAKGRKGVIDTPFEIFMAGMVGIAFGLLIVYGIREAFFDTTSDKVHRNLARIYCIVLLAVVVAPLIS